MQKLIDGIRRFRGQPFASRKALFQRLGGGQQPRALFITCSDSRIVPSLLTQTEPGELFVLRNAGNIVPPYEAALGGGEAATIEYAVAALKVPDIIVCGHSGCGAVTALLKPEARKSLPAVGAFLEHARDVGPLLQERYAAPRDEGERLSAAIEANVLVQLEHLRTHPAVARAIDRGELSLHGWVYWFETGDVFTYDPQTGRFDPLFESEA